jgi:HipA-like protein
MNLVKDPDKLEVYTEIRKSKLLVGTLSYDSKTKQFSFDYDRKYLLSKNAIPIGPELSLKKRHHISKNGLFPSFSDRIPSRENPAFEEYCLSQGILPTERNPIILLTTIGRRGPSTFVFEPIFPESSVSKEIIFFRKQVGLSLREISAAFDIALPTLSKIEMEKSRDKNTLKLLSIYLRFPEVALWQVRSNERKLHQNTAYKLITALESSLNERSQPELLTASDGNTGKKRDKEFI